MTLSLDDFEVLWRLKEEEVPTGHTFIAGDDPLVQRYMNYANDVGRAWAYTMKPFAPFNVAQLDWQQKGSSRTGYHSIAEDQTLTRDGKSIVLTISFGEPCEFRMRPKRDGDAVTVLMREDSVLVMGGQCQRTHEHTVSRVCAPEGRRIHMMFRMFYQ